MTSKRSLSASSNRDNHIENQSVKLRLCQICGDKARIINYGVLSCASCKTFFRRHGFDAQEVLVCYYNGNCPITVETRKNCTACRFAKCIAVGMIPELIRKEDLHEKYRTLYKSRKKTSSKKTVSVPQPCTLNLLSTDQSCLTTIDWRLFSNVINAFDTYSSVLHTQKFVNLARIHPRESQYDIESSLNMIAVNYTSLQSFVNCIADFRIMTTTEQCSLLQRNMSGLLAFYCMYVFRESGVFDNSISENVVLPLYGNDNVRSTKYISMRLEHDSTLVKLMSIILIFSSNCFAVDGEENLSNDSLLRGTFRLFGSQNVYVEILWKYMIYRYGYWDSARRFDSMIKTALDSLRLASNIYYSNKVHQNLVDNIAEKYENEVILNGYENTPLWGKI